MAGSIRLLPVHVANQIAAGEVVERPASVVKELIENALDADARTLRVDVVEGGRKRIEVQDDGIGMQRDDALMSIERQATSKIEDADDIARIATLGFRGEALAAIASVSRFQLLTCRRGETVGTEILMADGKLQDVRDVGAPPGTSVQVRDLFCNVPARRKFMRARATELSHIRTVFFWYALAYPACLMTLRVDGRETQRLPGGASLADRIRDLYGAELLASLRPLDWRGANIRIQGYVAPPAWSRGDRSEQYIFINQRPASAPVIGYALREAYALPDATRRPMVFLFIDLPVDQVDVNVHPTKREVRFRRTREVRDAVIEAVGAVVGARRVMRPDAPESGVSGTASAPAVPPPPVSQEWTLAMPPPVRPADRAATILTEPTADAAQRPADPPVATGAPAAPGGSCASPWAWYRLLGTIGDGRYLLLETDGGYVTLDPRAAHERVLFEKLMAQAEAGDPPVQPLLMPQSVKLSPRDAHTLRRHLPRLKALGFGIDDFGDDHFKVDALPAALGETACRALLVALVEDLARGGTRHEGARRWTEPIARAASRAAVSGRDVRSEAQRTRLIDDLAACRMPYTCPRGRPTMVFTSLRELDRKFGRD